MTGENRTNSLVFLIDQLLEEASQLAKTEHDASKFYSTLLQRATLAVEAQAASIWMLGPQASPLVVSAHQLTQIQKHAEQGQAKIDHAIADCIQSNQPKTLTAKNQTASMAVFCWPFHSGSESLDADHSADSAVAIYFTSDIDRELVPVYQSFVEAIAEIAADFHSRRNQTDRSEDQIGWHKFKSFSDALHENLDLRSTAVSLVNLGRDYYGCDRVLLAQRSGQSFKVIAASNAAVINRKAETIGTVESLVGKAFYRNNKPVAFHASEEPLSKLSQPFHRYQTVSGVEFLLLAPVLDKQGKTRFVQIIESASQDYVAAILKKVSFADLQTSSALNNASQHQAIPLRGILGTIGGSTLGIGIRRLALPLALMMTIALATAALWIFQTDLTVQASGNLVPESENVIFAAKDGVIQRLNAEHGGQVLADQTLIEMTSTELESELSRVAGEIETEKKRLNAIGAIKSSLDRGSTTDQRELGRLASQEIEASQRIENLRVELIDLELESTRLILKSPIGGTVVTWDAKTKLENRPVQQGDALLRVVSDNGNWLAEIRVPDSRIAHLINASSIRNNHQSPDSKRELDSIPVSLSVATFPERKFQGVIQSVAKSAEFDSQTQQSFIMVVVELENEPSVEFQAGSSVTAKFNCGKTSCGYAWFNEFIDSIRYRFF